MKKLNYHILIPVLFLLLVSSILGIAATQNGVNSFMDSTWYFTFARSIQLGKGLSAPITSWTSSDTRMFITQWPPLYPIILSIAPDIPNWARFVSFMSLAMSTILTYLIGYKLFDRQNWLALIPPLLFLTIPSVISSVFSVAHSEAPFTVLVLLALYLLMSYDHEDEISIRRSIVIAVIVGLAMLLRYLGVAIGGFAVLLTAWYALRSSHFKSRLNHVFIMLSSFFPLILYIGYLIQQTNTVSGGQPISNRLTLNDIPLGLRTIILSLTHQTQFLLQPLGLQSNWWSIILVGFIILFVVLLKRNMIRTTSFLNRYTINLAGFILIYLSILWFLAIISDQVLGSEDRHYVVIYPCIVILLIFGLWKLKLNRFVIIIFSIVWVISGLSSITKIQAGIGYNAPLYRDTMPSFISEKVGTFPSTTLLHTMHIGYLSTVVGDDYAIRSFNIDGFRQIYNCEDLIYPEEFTHAAFFSIDEPAVYARPREILLEDFIEWFKLCGELVEIVEGQSIIIVLFELDLE